MVLKMPHCVNGCHVFFAAAVAAAAGNNFVVVAVLGQ
jgi:hypothetical protein